MGVGRGRSGRGSRGSLAARGDRVGGQPHSASLCALAAFRASSLPCTARAAPKRGGPGRCGAVQVHVGEADDGTVAFRNLSMFRANTEEEALNLVGWGVRGERVGIFFWGGEGAPLLVGEDAGCSAEPVGHPMLPCPVLLSPPPPATRTHTHTCTGYIQQAQEQAAPRSADHVLSAHIPRHSRRPNACRPSALPPSPLPPTRQPALSARTPWLTPHPCPFPPLASSAGHWSHWCAAVPGRHQPHHQRDAHEHGLLAVALHIHDTRRGAQGAHAHAHGEGRVG